MNQVFWFPATSRVCKASIKTFESLVDHIYEDDFLKRKYPNPIDKKK